MSKKYEKKQLLRKHKRRSGIVRKRKMMQMNISDTAREESKKKGEAEEIIEQ